MQYHNPETIRLMFRMMKPDLFFFFIKIWDKAHQMWTTNSSVTKFMCIIDHKWLEIRRLQIKMNANTRCHHLINIFSSYISRDYKHEKC